ncbi:MAG: M20/M25/M40 family metallo-hydrolase [Deltaproteobacteria bacterium]|nr:M20/M25/M40 family metallo-hydrolase [Deltaproteobacteria bacterium]
MIDAQKAEAVLNSIRGEEAGALVMDLINIPSPPGRERGVAEYILNWFKQHGIEARRQEMGGDRLNAVGVIRGSGGGKSLTLNGHMDTAFAGEASDDLILGPEAGQPEYQPRAYVREGRIYGHGVTNDKGSVAAFMTAAKAIAKRGLTLKGDLVLAAVCGEIERAPVDEYQGIEYLGFGFGTRHLLSYGVVTDMAIVAEPCQSENSPFGVTWGLPGGLYLKISCFGAPLYAPYTRREAGQNAVATAARVINAVEEWGSAFESANRYEFENGVIVPKVNIGAIRGGLPYKPNYSPGVCRIYVDIRIPPQRNPLDVAQELKQVLDRLSLKYGYQVDIYRSQVGYHVPYERVASLVEVLQDAHAFLFDGARMGKAIPTANSTWNDLNLYSERAIPAVKCGVLPAPGVKGKERLSLRDEDLANLAKIYALAAMQICNSER